jgi:hypothetical protein
MNNFKKIKKHCCLKIKINNNIECRHRRKIISGLDGCLCKLENCTKMKELANSSKH